MMPSVLARPVILMLLVVPLVPPTVNEVDALATGCNQCRERAERQAGGAAGAVDGLDRVAAAEHGQGAQRLRGAGAGRRVVDQAAEPPLSAMPNVTGSVEASTPPWATTTEPALIVSKPVLVLAVPPRVRVPMPFLVSVPVVVVMLPVMLTLPVPPKTAEKVPLLRLARLSCVVVDGRTAERIGLEEAVVDVDRCGGGRGRGGAERQVGRPGARNSPPPTVKVLAPRLRVPSVLLVAVPPSVASVRHRIWSRRRDGRVVAGGHACQLQRAGRERQGAERGGAQRVALLAARKMPAVKVVPPV